MQLCISFDEFLVEKTFSLYLNRNVSTTFYLHRETRRFLTDLTTKRRQLQNFHHICTLARKKNSSVLGESICWPLTGRLLLHDMI